MQNDFLQRAVRFNVHANGLEYFLWLLATYNRAVQSSTKIDGQLT